MYIPDPPHALYFIGNPDTLGRPQVSIVGSRKCSDYGRNAAYNIAKELALYGIHIVSGLACGIDGAAQKGCVDAEEQPMQCLDAEWIYVHPRAILNFI